MNTAFFPSVETLRVAQENDGTSLGIVKPKIVNRVIIHQRNSKEVEGAIAKKDSVVNQLDLFEEKKDLYILPVRIIIEFSCNDPNCIGHKMSILDWEFGQLYRKIIKSADWQEKIKLKILDEIFAANGIGDVVDYRDLLHAAFPTLQVSIGKLKCLLKAHGSLLRLSGLHLR